MARNEAAKRLAHELLRVDPDAVASEIETTPDSQSAAFLAEHPPRLVAAVLRLLSPDRAARILALLPEAVLAGAIAALDPARVAALLARLDEAERQRCLEAADPGLAEELRALMSYPPDSAGAMMDPRVTSFRPDATRRDVIRRLRRFRDRRIHDVFVVGEDGRLLGAVALQDVVLADAETPLAALIAAPPVAVHALAPRSEVVETFERHRLASVPVVDVEGRLLGLIRDRQVVRAAAESATAAAVTMVGASEEERALSPPWVAVRKRLPWLEVNLLTAFLAASVVGIFEETIAQVTALAVLLPVVAGQSGNTGAQALAVTMRGLALREVRVRHWARVAAKELAAGFGNGVVVALTTAGAVYLWSSSVGLAAVIGISMVISMSLAGLSGAAIPMVLTALRQDPAQSSSIVLTTVTDVVGFFSFLGIATLLRPMI